MAHDDVGLEEFHDDKCHVGVVVEDCRSEPRGMAGLTDKGEMLEVRPREGQRPALANQADIGERLLDGNAAGRAAHLEDQIEIAVTDLLDSPSFGCASKQVTDHRNAAEQCGQALRRLWHIGLRYVIDHAMVSSRLNRTRGRLARVGQTVQNRISW